MLRRVSVLIVLAAVFFGQSLCVNPGPRYPPTKGEVWPRPQNEKKERNYFVLNATGVIFNLTLSAYRCGILDRAIDRYTASVGNKHGVVRRVRRRGGHHHRRDANCKGIAPELFVMLSNPCETYPSLEMAEDYHLQLSADDYEAWTLQSDSIWGILRGLETYVQLFYYTDDFSEARINVTTIDDFPRYKHRGLLLDTSRHYISTRNIQLTLDAMAMNKLNVFHWHIVDDQSFPFVSQTFPDLSKRGAFHPSMVYTAEDVSMIIDYARDRGIRVVPEFDVPGHTRSWGEAFPQLLTECYDKNQTRVTGLGPMHPIRDGTYKMLRELFAEVQARFPDNHFHIGGDEVDMDCWESNPELQSYMQTHNLTVTQLHALFMQRALPLLGNGTKALVWQEVFDEDVPLNKNVLVHIWKSGSWIEELFKVLAADYKVIFSGAWYLDHLANDGDWEKFYQADPAAAIRNETLARNIVGGEACMWGESVDDNNVISRVWPRASAVAERLWSPLPKGLQDSFWHFQLIGWQVKVTNEVRRRLEEHTCRMIRRGIRAQPPNGPGFCYVV